ncbi:hypothetical protein GCM10022226_75340 [Sphaerisporangium flaviroseum]|uniref:Uncharacterized protein n=1 Tax=Sphaerisporangium flaviroseum TaxID=509199 RepID=A0ABP7JCY4_9ACTN
MTYPPVLSAHFNFVAKVCAVIVPAADACSIAIGGCTTLTAGTTRGSGIPCPARVATWGSAPASAIWDPALTGTNGTIWD